MTTLAGLRPNPELLIDGCWTASSSDQRIQVIDPSTEAVIGSIPDASLEDVDSAVAAARRAFDAGPWSHMPPLEREARLHAFADLLEQHAGELAAIESLDVGKPIGLARTLDAPAAVAWMRYFAGWPSKLAGETIPISQSGMFHAYVRREPVGVCALIVPWNYPLTLLMWKLAPALAAGCTVVIKPASLTPYSAVRVAELALEAGLPTGVVNLVLGSGRGAGAALAAHPGVDKVSFTGSTETGRSIVQGATGDFKRVTLELGGKSANVIFSDADLATAIPAAAQACFLNSGQLCFAASRLLVQRSIYEEVLDGLRTFAGSLPVGPASDEGSFIGPLVSADHLERVMRWTLQASATARVVVGGERRRSPGFFLSPTVVADVPHDASLFQEEVFGPILAVTPFDDEADAVRLANASRYGLSANVWTRDLGRGHRVAGAVKAGTVWVNCHLAVDPAMPFGGMRESGWGRENGREAMLAYTEAKSVCVNIQ